jgi:hypothetical protein
MPANQAGFTMQYPSLRPPAGLCRSALLACVTLSLASCAGLPGPVPGQITPPPKTIAAEPMVVPAVETGTPAAAPPAQTGAGVFLTEAEARQARARSVGEASARTLRDKVMADADALAAAPLAIPRAGGQWTHWYACPADGAVLTAESASAHRCPTCNKVYSGWPYDAAYISRQHIRWLHGLETLGWAYTLEPKPAYAARVRAILLEYAAFYKDLPLHDRNNKASKSQARLFAQTLDEAVALCTLSVGYDRIRAAGLLSEADQRAINEDLIRPMVATIQGNPAGISNWQSWHNAAVAVAGCLLDDQALIDWAVRGREGFLFQLDRSLLETGLWYEGSPSYHWYALRAHLYLLESLARRGENLYGKPRVRAMFDAPLRQVYPDLSFPALNDSDRSSLLSMGMYYAIAWRRYSDLRYAEFARTVDHPWMLAWGAAAPGTGKPALRLVSSDEPSEGLAILRNAENSIAVMLDYGPGTSGHVHPAKLGLLLFAGGNERLVDPGRLPYGSPLHQGWFTQTVAHNTVVVNGRSQQRSGGERIQFEPRATVFTLRAVLEPMLGQPQEVANLLTALDPGQPMAFAAARSRQAYTGVTLERVVVLQGQTVLDIFLATSDAPATFDLPLHWRAKLAGLDGLTPAGPLGDADGYPHLRKVQAVADPDRRFTADFGKKGRIAVQVLDDAPLFLAEGLGVKAAETIPVVVRRQQGTRALFAAVYTVQQHAN